MKLRVIVRSHHLAWPADEGEPLPIRPCGGVELRRSRQTLLGSMCARLCSDRHEVCREPRGCLNATCQMHTRTVCEQTGLLWGLTYQGSFSFQRGCRPAG